MIRLCTLCAILLFSLNAGATEYPGRSTDALLDMRASIMTQQERHSLNTELQKRLQSMSEQQMQRYLSPPSNPSYDGRGYRGMQDGRIATH